MTSSSRALDPITFEVLKHRLWQITDEQAIAIKTISASPIVVEGNDFNVGIFALEGILREAGEVHDGDVYLTNDPFLGALHQNDVILASPLFVDDRLVLWVANVLHHADVVGIDLVEATMAESLEGAAVTLRKRLADLTDGSWEADVYMDGDRVGSDALLTVHVRLDKSGDQLRFDYTGSSPQARAAVNSTLHATYAASLVPVYTYICAGEIDWNDAVKECVSITAPERTVVNALPPAPVSICTVAMRWLATVAASRVVADLLLASPGFEDRVVPSWSVSANCNYVFSTLPDGRVAGALLSDHRAGGAAARPWGDGISHSGQQTSFSSNVANVESVEEKLPVLYLHRRALADSGGPGRYRGGLTAESALVPFGVDELLLNSTNTAGTDPTNASGIAGGYPGAGSQVYLARGADVLGAFARGEWPELDRQTLLHLPSKAQATIGAAGEVD